MGTTGGASDGEVAEADIGMIANTYTDGDITKNDFLVEGLYDSSTLTALITRQAMNAKDDINNFIGRTIDFTPAELTLTRNKAIVLSASQYTAYLMQRRPQERADSISEDTTLDGGEAKARLIIWMKNNNLIPPEEKKTTPIATKLSILHSEVGKVI